MLKPCSLFTYDQLADIYNQARVDYIVPMPMNGKRMAEYIHYYDIDLEGSFVSYNDENLETGIGMLGVREERGWITRLGVLPHRRGNRTGKYITDAMLQYAGDQNLRRIQLEVIIGNDPAHHLFRKLGFEDRRELLVIRRPPGKLELVPHFEDVKFTEIDEGKILYYLEQRTSTPSWLDETASMLNAGNLKGYVVETRDHGSNWLIFQPTTFQLTRFVFGDFVSDFAMQALLYHLHRLYPMQDTKVENIALESDEWRVYQTMGYFEVFRRMEMILTL